MAALIASSDSLPAGNSEWALSSVRPVTLLIASGIVLIAAILIITGLAAGHLHEQALANTERELSRISGVFAETSDHSLLAVDALIRESIERVQAADIGTPDDYARKLGGPDAHLAMKRKLAGIIQVSEIALVASDGRIVNSSEERTNTQLDLSGQDYFQTLKARPGGELFVGAPGVDPATGTAVIPLARRIEARDGSFLGLVVATTPSSGFESYFRSVAFSADSAISLVRSDGTLLLRYPASDRIGRIIRTQLFTPDRNAGTNETLRERSPIDGEWRIKSWRMLPHFPVGVLLTRSADQALAGWSHQAVLFGIFSLGGVTAIAIMVFLIARQFGIYATLATMRAEKMQADHARITAEAELLKKERLSVLGQLTATVAHELRNPLSAIRNTVFSIKEIAAAKGVKLDRPVARMERSIERCDRIIADLLEYTKQREIQRQLVEFDSWLEEVLSEQTLAAEISLVHEFAGGSAVVPIDADRLRRVVINLVDNAAQAMLDPQARCAEKRITIRTAVRGGRLDLVIEDTGPGIRPDHLSRIFEPLFSTKSFGTGLGLATVKQIIGQHDGTVRVDSEVGRGTSVIVQLPIEQIAEDKAAA